MIERFLAFMKKHRLATSGDKVLLAVSGGVDSMVMAHLFKEADMQIGVVHVNYGLRGKDADGDEKLVEAWAAAHKIPFHLRRAGKALFEGNLSVEMAAREFRYAYFRELTETEGYTKVATAHHLGDSLETLLLNLTKGTGLKGLMGVPLKAGDIIRPMLFLSRGEIEKYARDNGIRWREDVSNAENDYQRNIIRNKVIPVLKTINPALLEHFDKTLYRIRGSYEVLEERLGALREQALTTHPGWNSGYRELRLDWYGGGAADTVLLAEWMKDYGFHFSLVQDLAGSIEAGIPGKIFYSDQYEVNLDRDRLIIRRRERSVAGTAYLNVPGQTRIGAYTFHARFIEGNAFSAAAGPDVVFMDAERADLPLKVRRWKQGDKFQPLGMKGKKKISDFMIDSKIPLTLKKDVMVLESAGRIAWLVGLRPDDRFKVTSKTKRMLKIEVLRHV